MYVQVSMYSSKISKQANLRGTLCQCKHCFDNPANHHPSGISIEQDNRGKHVERVEHESSGEATKEQVAKSK